MPIKTAAKGGTSFQNKIAFASNDYSMEAEKLQFLSVIACYPQKFTGVVEKMADKKGAVSRLCETAPEMQLLMLCEWDSR